MSGEALAGVPAGELASVQRVQQLQTLIEQASRTAVSSARTGESSAYGPATEQGGAFSTALAAAAAATAPASSSASSPAPAGSEGGGEYEAMIQQAAQRYGLNPAVLHGLIQQESGFDAGAQSSAGASGLTQLMPATAAAMGVSDPLDPAESIEGGARYLSGLMSRFGGNTEEALAAYNAGPGAVEQYGGIPPYAETQSYVSKVLGYAEAFTAAHPGSLTPVAA
jgi:soluble lytic murein transglycosylase-like protein